MPRPLVLVLVAIAFLVARQGGDAPVVRGQAPPLEPPRAEAGPPAGTFTFDPGVSEINRRAFLAVLGHVRPEARALYERVAPVTRIVDGDTGHERALAITRAGQDGYTIVFRFGDVFARLGQRGFDRVVEHELAHVVDYAVLTDELRAQLDAGIPAGVPCEQGGVTGSCAPQQERFAESFAKWASGDIGVNLYAGYAVPPPGDLEAWGAPLAALAGGGS
jgi:hypothetical protein